MLNFNLSNENIINLKTMLKELYPLHRTLVGPGFKKSLEIAKKFLPIHISEFPSGKKVFDWTIPQAFEVEECYVEAPDGSRPIDFKNDCYHAWNYGASFSGVLSREELVKKISTLPSVPNAIPLRDTYYRRIWGISASQNCVDSLKDGDYKVSIKSRFWDDFLRIGEFYIPGESSEEIFINSYLCHPKGANDNLSGVVLCLELFKLLSQAKKLKYSYRLAIWPETIGAITYLASYPERLKNIKAVLCLSIIGDKGKFTYKKSNLNNSYIDRVVEHALKFSGKNYEIRPYNPIGTDERQFNTKNIGLDCGLLQRTPANEYEYYHSNKDDLEFVTAEQLFESLEVTTRIIEILERNKTYTPTYMSEPFLSGHGIYPYDQGMGTGEKGGVFNRIVMSYFNLIAFCDGKRDLINIADRCNEDIKIFDRAINDFYRTGLIQ